MSTESDVLMQRFRQAVYERLTAPGAAHGISPEGAIERRLILFRSWQSALQAKGESEALAPELARHWAVADVTAFRDVPSDRRAIAEDDIFKSISANPAYGRVLSLIDAKLFEQVNAAAAENEQKTAEKLGLDVRELEQVRPERAIVSEAIPVAQRRLGDLVAALYEPIAHHWTAAQERQEAEFVANDGAVRKEHEKEPVGSDAEVVTPSTPELVRTRSSDDGPRDKSSDERLATEGARQLVEAALMRLGADSSDDYEARNWEKEWARSMEDEAYKKLAAVHPRDARVAVAAERSKILDSQLQSSVRFDDDKHRSAVAVARRRNAATWVPRDERSQSALPVQQRREADTLDRKPKDVVMPSTSESVRARSDDDASPDNFSNERLATEGAMQLIKAAEVSLSASYSDDHVSRNWEKDQARRMEDEAYKKLAAVQPADARAAVATERAKITSDDLLHSSVRFDDDKHRSEKSALLVQQRGEADTLDRKPEDVINPGTSRDAQGEADAEVRTWVAGRREHLRQQQSRNNQATGDIASDGASPSGGAPEKKYRAEFAGQSMTKEQIEYMGVDPARYEARQEPSWAEQRREADWMGLNRQQEDGFVAGLESERDQPVDPETTISKVLENATYKTRLDGSVLYLIDNRPAFVDHGKQILMEPKANDDEEAILAAVLLAKEKYGGAFEVTGSDEFKRRAIGILLKHEIDVTLKNPQQDALRRELVKAGQTTGQASTPVTTGGNQTPIKPLIGKAATDQYSAAPTETGQASKVIMPDPASDDRARRIPILPTDGPLDPKFRAEGTGWPPVNSVDSPGFKQDGAQEPHPSGLIAVRALDWWSVQHAAIHIWAKSEIERQVDLERLGPEPADNLVYWFDRSGEQCDAPADATARFPILEAAENKSEAGGLRPVVEEELRARGATDNSEISARTVLNVNLKEFDMAAVESNDQDPKLILRGVRKLDNGEFDTTVLLFKGKGDYLQGYVKIGDQKHQVIAHINERKPDHGTGEVKPNFLKLSEPHAVGDDTKWKEIGFGNAVNRRKDDKAVYFDEVLFSVGSEVVKARVTKHVDADMHRQLGFEESRKARPKEDSLVAPSGDTSPKPKAPAAKEKEDAAGAKEKARRANAPKDASPKSGAAAAAANENAARASKAPRSGARARAAV